MGIADAKKRAFTRDGGQAARRRSPRGRCGSRDLKFAPLFSTASIPPSTCTAFTGSTCSRIYSGNGA